MAKNDRAKLLLGVLILPSWLPVKSAWLNPIEPRWAHSKRAVAGPDRVLAAQHVSLGPRLPRRTPLRLEASCAADDVGPRPTPHISGRHGQYSLRLRDRTRVQVVGGHPLPGRRVTRFAAPPPSHSLESVGQSESTACTPCPRVSTSRREKRSSECPTRRRIGWSGNLPFGFRLPLPPNAS